MSASLLRRTLRLLVTSVTAVLAIVTAGAVAPAHAADVSVSLTNQAWDSAYTAGQADVDHNWFMGHPLDAVWDGAGNAFAIGEYAQQVARVTGGTTATGYGLPLRYLGNWDWVDPFVSSFGAYAEPDVWGNRWLKQPYTHTSTSELNERVIRAGGYVWTAFGGSMYVNPSVVDADNHSILMRINVSNPNDTCAVPVPGDNNQVTGLAYDGGNRIYFTQATGDHLTRTSTTHSTLSFVKNNTGLCRNNLDWNNRGAAQTTINRLACTSTTNGDWSADCVHRLDDTMPQGATHLTFDGNANALWINNGNNKLYKYDIGARAIRPGITIPGADAFRAPWQIASNGSHVFLNEYFSNKIQRYTKSTGAWSTVTLPVASGLRTHSITLAGGRLWFSVSDEKLQNSPNDPVRSWLGYLNLSTWNGTSVSGVRLTGWDRLPHGKGAHSFRGLDINGAGRIVVTNDGNREVTTLTPR